MLMWRGVLVAVCLGSVLAGCSTGSSDSSGGSATTATESIADYGQRVQPVYDEMNAALTAVQTAGQTASNASGLADYAAACRRVQDAADAVDGALPTPDDELTSDISSAVNDLDRGSQLCQTAVETVDRDMSNEAVQYLQQGMGHWQDAVARLQTLQ